ncbi:acid-soluble spore protein N [Bacillus sp. FJAT-29790]|nr:acid-soluble spore protein N [Bacillus sp. FJAT-29790]MBU8878334.1 acid-soluble spore protein N [Bacillus sp. FJAT-29790]
MSNPKRSPNDFKPDHIGTQSRAFGGNKGKKMQDQTSPNPQVIQTKGE